jgi:hypothetical protein
MDFTEDLLDKNFEGYRMPSVRVIQKVRLKFLYEWLITPADSGVQMIDQKIKKGIVFL